MLPQQNRIEVRHLDPKVQVLGAGNLFENGDILELDLDQKLDDLKEALSLLKIVSALSLNNLDGTES
jgi:hypothetical protein